MNYMKNKIMKSFNVDFNWLNGTYAPSTAFADADPKAIVDYYADMGASNFWTFAVTYNGYAMYPSHLAPVPANLKTNFMKESCDYGHEKGMEVFAYLCLAANPCWEELHPEFVRPLLVPGYSHASNYWRLVLNDEYLDYFCGILDEALNMADLDGIVIDWFRHPCDKREVWIPSEIELFKSLMDIPFPEDAAVDELTEIDFDRRVLAHAWRRIKNTVMTHGDIKIWTNHPFDRVDDPVWNNHVLLQEVDYVLNEGPDTDMLEWINQNVGPQTMVIQNLCGWADHKADIWKNIDLDQYGLFGFAAADPTTKLPSVSHNKTDYENLEMIKTAYHEIG